MDGRGGRWGSPGRPSRGQWHSPRYRGNKAFSPHAGAWPQHQEQHSPYQFQPPFSTSTPIQRHHHQYPQQQGPYFQSPGGRGRGGRPFNNFNSPRSSFNRSDEGGIEKWVHPSMWQDPWKEFQEDDYEGDLSYLERERNISISATQFPPPQRDLEETGCSTLSGSCSTEPSLSSSVGESPSQPTASIIASKKTDDDELNSPQDLLNLITS